MLSLLYMAPKLLLHDAGGIIDWRVAASACSLSVLLLMMMMMMPTSSDDSYSSVDTDTYILEDE